MSKKRITFRVDSDLLTHFKSAALRARRTPTEILVQFITDYVQETHARNSVDITKTTLSQMKIGDGKVVDFAYASARRKRMIVQKNAELLVQHFFNSDTD